MEFGMTKEQSIHQFWSSFGLPAYDVNTVDDDAEMPYITYDVSTGSIDDFILLTGSLWYRSTSWNAITQKAHEIEEYLTTMSPPTIKIDGGRAYFTKGTPFSRRMAEPGDDFVRRIYIQINAEFLTN